MSTLSKEQIDRIVHAHGAGIRTALEDAGGQRSGSRPRSTRTAAGCRTSTRASARRSSNWTRTGSCRAVPKRWPLRAR